MSYVGLVFRLRGDSHTSTGVVRLDALVSESTRLESQVTRHYVEDGAPVNDHISPESEELQISGVITGANVTLFGGPAGRTKMIAAKEALREIHTRQLPVSVVTGMDVYKPYAMKSCRISREDALEQYNVELDFVKIRTATAEKDELPVEKVADRVKGMAGPTRKPVKGKQRKLTEEEESELREKLYKRG